MLQLLPPQDGLSRRQLDLALLVAEQEPVSGLPAWPSPFPLAEGDADFSSTFGLRRVECMAGSHKLKVAELTSHLKLLQVGVVGYTVCVRRGGGRQTQGAWRCYGHWLRLLHIGACRRASGLCGAALGQSLVHEA